jgi:hypothetical protein
MLVCQATKATTPRRDRAEGLRARKIADIVRLTAALERGLAGDLHRIFNRIARAAAKLAAQGQPFAAPGVVDHYHDAIMAVWRARQHAAAVEMARHTLRGLGQIEKAAPETKFLSLIDIATSAITNWLAEFGGEQVRKITDGTKRIIRRALVKGNELNEPPRVLAKRIREDVGGEIGLRRARTIARTETHAAANVGSDVAATATGLVLEDEWGSTEDHRTRPTHAAADGQRVPHGRPFIVGGFPLRFPGDPDGPPQEIINCRCVVLYRPVLPGVKPASRPQSDAPIQPVRPVAVAPKPKPLQPGPAPALKPVDRPKPAPQPSRTDGLRRVATDAAEKLWDAARLRDLRESAAKFVRGAFDRLSVDQMVMLRWYTGNGYSALNRSLREASASADQLLQRDAINGALEAATKRGAGTFYRRVDIDAARVRDLIAQFQAIEGTDDIYVSEQFVSTATVPQTQFGGSLEFVISGHSGVYVDPVSLHSGEKEVLFRALSKFKVSKVDPSETPPKVYLTEVGGVKSAAPEETKSEHGADWTEEQRRRWMDKMNSGGPGTEPTTIRIEKAPKRGG